MAGPFCRIHDSGLKRPLLRGSGDLLRLFRPLTTALAIVLIACAPALAAGVQATATYGITLGGTHIASVTIGLTDTGKRYAMSLNARITGLAQMVASGIAKVESVGISAGSGLVAEKSDLLIRAQGEDFTVGIRFAGGDVSEFKVNPPIVNNIGRIAIERRHLRTVNDMMAAFVLKGGRLDPGLCNRKVRVFTGVERFDLAMRFAKADEATSKRTGYQGPLILCNLRYTPVSGHYTNSEMTSYLQRSERILVWFAPLAAPGYFIPYRALLATEAGDLSIVLTDLAQ